MRISPETLAEVGVIAVIRAPSADAAVAGTRALVAGGVTGIEITYSTPDAASAISRVNAEFGSEVLLGAGTLRTVEQVAEASEAGARFLVAPGFDADLAAAMCRTGLTTMIGALTPSEVMTAESHGADVVKIFPAGLFGPALIRNLRGPFPNTVFMPTGGVSATNIADWVAAGVVAVDNTVFTGTFPINVDTVRTNFINNANNRQFAPRAYAPDYDVPERVYQYSLSMQQEMPGKFVVSAAYVGSQGHNLFLRSIANRIISVDAATGTVTREFDIPVQGSATPLRPFAEIDYKTSGGHDSYNALQLSLVKRSNTGLTMNSQYTLGRSFGNSAGSNEAVTAANNARAIEEFDFEEGYNNFDIRHNFNASVVYALPIGQGRTFMNNMSPVANAILGGWEIGGIANARSGLPINVLITRPDIVFVDAAGVVYSNAGAGRTAVVNTPGGGSTRATRRPDLIPGANIFLDNDRQLLNPAAFTLPKPGTFGNFPRNGARGPKFRQVDLMLSKKFPVRETLDFEFRTEVFNLFNFTNFAAPPATLGPATDSTGRYTVQPGQALSSTTFGVMTSTVERSVGLGTNRQVQFALRLSF